MPANENDAPAVMIGVDDSHMKEVVLEDSQKLFNKPRVFSASGGVRTVNVSPSPPKAVHNVDHEASEEDMKMMGFEISRSKKNNVTNDGKEGGDSADNSPSSKKMPSPGHYENEQPERSVEELMKIAEEFDQLPENKVLSSYANIPKTPGWGKEDEMLVEDV